MSARPVPPFAARHLREGERVLWWGRPSLRGLLAAAPLALAPVALVAAGVWLVASRGAASPGAFALFAAFALFGGLLRRTGLRAVHILTSAYVITESRLVAVRSLVETTVESVPFERVSRVSWSQGPVERALRLQTLEVSAYGARGARVLLPALASEDSALAEASAGMLRGANAAWLLRSD